MRINVGPNCSPTYQKRNLPVLEDGELSMSDVVYLLAGLAVLALGAGYALLLKRI